MSKKTAHRAIHLNIRNLRGDVRGYDVSLGAGFEVEPADLTLHNQLNRYIIDDLNSITECQNVNHFLLCSGFGLSNVILLAAGDPFIVYHN